MSKTRIICQCGGEVPRPIPPTCPHCGKVIASVRRPVGAWLWPILVIAGFFALLLGGVFGLLWVFGAG
jgi:hypothetical protein